MSNLSFTKLFSSITASSVWQESYETRLVWITMLSMADPLGRVSASIPGLAHMSRVPLAETQAALQIFLQPDTYSRSKDHDGRRVEEIAGGWQLLNYKMYREMRDEEVRKEQNRIYQERRRKKMSDHVSNKSDSQHLSDKNLTVRNNPDNQPPSAQVEEEVEEEVDKSITGDMVSRGVLSELRLSGRDLSVALDEVCRAELKAGADPSELRDAMIASWNLYDSSKPNLSYTKGATKFFGDGDWRNKAGWPWKAGLQPNEVKPTTAAEKMLRLA